MALEHVRTPPRHGSWIRGYGWRAVEWDEHPTAAALDAVTGGADVAWFDVNAGSTGFYRVAYDADSLAALARNLPALAPAERIGLLADEWALVRAGEREFGDVAELLSAFTGEEDHAVLDEVAEVDRVGHGGRHAARQRLNEWQARLNPVLLRLRQGNP